MKTKTELGELRRVPYDQVVPDPNQPRKTFNAVKMHELAESISHSGIAEPLLVRWISGLKVEEPDLLDRKLWQAVDDAGRAVSTGSEKAVREFVKGREKGFYQIVDGERRWRAAGILKLPELPVNVTKLDDKQIFVIQYVKNQQRENLTALEEAESFRARIEERKKTDPTYNADKLAQELGKSRSHVFGQMALTRLTPAVRETLLAGEISTSVAGLVAMVPGEALQKELLKEICNRGDWQGPLPVRRVKELIDEKYIVNLRGALWKLDDTQLLPKVGCCEKCPKRSYNMTGDFPELNKNPNICTDVTCYEAKKDAAVERKLRVAKEEGQQVLKTNEVFGQYSLKPGFVDIHNSHSMLGWNKTFSQVLGKKAPEPILVPDQAGEVREVLKIEDAEKALKQAGFKLETTNGNGYAAENKKLREQQKKEKQLAAVAAAAAPKLNQSLVWFQAGNAARGVVIEEGVWKMLAKAVYACTSIDAHAFLAKVRGWAKTMNDSREAIDKWFKADHIAEDYGRFVVELLLVANWNGGGWHSAPKFSNEFKELCDLAKVDLVKLEKELAEKPKKEKGEK